MDRSTNPRGQRAIRTNKLSATAAAAAAAIDWLPRKRENKSFPCQLVVYSVGLADKFAALEEALSWSRGVLLASVARACSRRRQLHVSSDREIGFPPFISFILDLHSSNHPLPDSPFE
jgi:hypothetical protein